MTKSFNYQILLVLGLGILIGGAAKAFWSNPVNDAPVASPQTEISQREPKVSGQSSKIDEISDLRREVALLRQNLASLESRVANSAIEQSSLASASATLEEEPKLNAEDEQQLAQKEKAQQKERLQLINRSFNSEKKDQQWAKQANLAIDNAISRWTNNNKHSDYNLKQAECHSSLCRVEITLPNGQALANFQTAFHRNIGTSLPGMTMSANQNNDGTITATAFLVREGSSFPE